MQKKKKKKEETLENMKISPRPMCCLFMYAFRHVKEDNNTLEAYSATAHGGVIR